MENEYTLTYEKVFTEEGIGEFLGFVDANVRSLFCWPMYLEVL